MGWISLVRVMILQTSVVPSRGLSIMGSAKGRLSTRSLSRPLPLLSVERVKYLTVSTGWSASSGRLATCAGTALVSAAVMDGAILNCMILKGEAEVSARIMVWPGELEKSMMTSARSAGAIEMVGIVT